MKYCKWQIKNNWTIQPFDKSSDILFDIGSWDLCSYLWALGLTGHSTIWLEVSRIWKWTDIENTLSIPIIKRLMNSLFFWKKFFLFLCISICTHKYFNRYRTLIEYENCSHNHVQFLYEWFEECPTLGQKMWVCVKMPLSARDANQGNLPHFRINY